MQAFTSCVICVAPSHDGRTTQPRRCSGPLLRERTRPGLLPADPRVVGPRDNLPPLPSTHVHVGVVSLQSGDAGLVPAQPPTTQEPCDISLRVLVLPPATGEVEVHRASGSVSRRWRGSRTDVGSGAEYLTALAPHEGECRDGGLLAGRGHGTRIPRLHSPHA